MCAPSPPPAPDYAAAAQQQGVANIEAARVQGQINNPNVSNPYGSQSVTWGQFDEPGYQQAIKNYETFTANNNLTGAQQDTVRLLGYTPEFIASQTPEWRQARQEHLDTVPLPTGIQSPGQYPDRANFTLTPNTPNLTQKFSPEQQAIYDAANRVKLSLSNLAGQGAETAHGVVGKPVDFSKIGTTADKTYQALMSRFNEDYARQKDVGHSNLIASGLRPGSKAYDNAMALMERTRTDAEIQAQVQSRKDAIAEMLMERQVPLNEITALMSGSQISNPFAVPGYAQNAQVGAAPTFAATQAGWNAQSDIYNQQAAQAGNLQQGLFGLGTAGLGVGGSYLGRPVTNVNYGAPGRT